VPRTTTVAKKVTQKQRPASTPEARENQMIYYAEKLAEKQLIEGTASPSVITHYLKLGSTKEKLEREKLEKENQLLEAKTDLIQNTKKMDELYAQALNAMMEYKGESPLVGDDDEDL